MGKAWKEIDLAGEGLQSANILLARLLKRRPRAYVLLALFPLGLHRDYLEDRRMGWVYRALSAGAVGSAASGATWLALGICGILGSLALHDLRWIDDRIATLNKALRKKVYLARRPGAPRGYRGRYTDEIDDGYPPEKGQEGAGDARSARGRLAPRVPSFAEQEALLRELARRKRREDS